MATGGGGGVPLAIGLKSSAAGGGAFNGMASLSTGCGASAPCGMATLSTGGGVLEVAGDAFATLSPRVVVLVLASSIGLRNIVVVLVPLCLSNWLIGLVAPRHRLQNTVGWQWPATLFATAPMLVEQMGLASIQAAA